MGNAEIASSVRIVWDYTPSDFFEERTTFQLNDINIEIENGRATACVPSDTFERQQDLKETLQETLKFIFLGALPYRRKVVEFSGGSMYRTLPDGRSSISHWKTIKLRTDPQNSNHPEC